MNFLKTITIDSGNCQGLGQIVQLIRNVLNIAFILLAIVLVVLIIIDLFKAVVASEEKEVKGYQKAAIRRVIYTIAIFFVVSIVTLVFNLVGDTSGTDVPNWLSCWTNPVITCEENPNAPGTCQ